MYNAWLILIKSNLTTLMALFMVYIALNHCALYASACGGSRNYKRGELDTKYSPK